MNAVFADSYYYLALLNPQDAAHRRVTEITSHGLTRTVTTVWVLTEVADALGVPGRRQAAIDLVQVLKRDRNARILPASQRLFERGFDLYARRPDKAWSLTDCISFIVMNDLGIRGALTGDHHFEQAGFEALLK